MPRPHANTKHYVESWPLFKVEYWGPNGEKTRFIRASTEDIVRILLNVRAKVWQIHNITTVQETTNIYKGTYEGVPVVPAIDVSEASNSKLAEMGG